MIRILNISTDRHSSVVLTDFTVEPLNYIFCVRADTHENPFGSANKVAVVVRLEVNKETGNRRGYIKSS